MLQLPKLKTKKIFSDISPAHASQIIGSKLQILLRKEGLNETRSKPEKTTRNIREDLRTYILLMTFPN